jgi:Putative metallopeptidase
MPRWIVSVALACLSALTAAFGTAALAQQPTVVVSYEEPTNPDLRPIYEALKKYAILEELKAFLLPLRLPRQLTVHTGQCGATSIEFRPEGVATVCYEMVEQIEKMIAKHTHDPALSQTVMTGAVIQIVLHETARALFDVLQVPIWGRQRDAADRLAAFIMVEFGEDISRVAILGTANLFLWSDKKWTGTDFSDVASPDYQRFFNYVCMGYAADPLQFGGLVENGTLPRGRADRCQGEYEQVRKAFNLRIMPYVDPDLLIKSRATAWSAWSAKK